MNRLPLTKDQVRQWLQQRALNHAPLPDLDVMFKQLKDIK